MKMMQEKNYRILQQNYKIHLIDVNKDKKVCEIHSRGVPRIGEEIRMAPMVFKVIYVVWAYDEVAEYYERVNVGIEMILPRPPANSERSQKAVRESLGDLNML